MLIKTSRLLLRPYVPEDFEDYYAYIKDRELHTMLGLEGVGDRDCALINFQWFLDNRVFIALENRETGRVIGHICIHPPLKQVAEDPQFSGKEGADLSFALTRQAWRRGLMTEALEAAISCLFQEGRAYLDCEHELTNTASAALQRKLGFQFWGTERFAGTELTINVLQAQDWMKKDDPSHIFYSKQC